MVGRDEPAVLSLKLLTSSTTSLGPLPKGTNEDDFCCVPEHGHRRASHLGFRDSSDEEDSQSQAASSRTRSQAAPAERRIPWVLYRRQPTSTEGK